MADSTFRISYLPDATRPQRRYMTTRAASWDEAYERAHEVMDHIGGVLVSITHHDGPVHEIRYYEGSLS